MKGRTGAVVVGLSTGLAMSATAASGQTLFGVNFNAGVLRSFDAQTGVSQIIGETGIVGLSGLDRGRDGFLYSFQNTTRDFYRIDPATAQATLVGNMGVEFEFEGGLAIVDETTAYAIGGRDTDAGAALFRVDLATGSATELASLGQRDIDALTVRSDGVLVGFSHLGVPGPGSPVFTIDPDTLVVQGFDVPGISGFGLSSSVVAGMTGDGTTGYLATTGQIPTLFTFDLYTGEVRGSVALENNYSGIAIPAPGAAGLIGLAGLRGVRRRRG